MQEHVLILGGGVIGLSAAFECARRGHQVTVLERGVCGGQASGAAAGMLAPFSENGEGADDFFRLCLDSLRLYPEWQAEVKRVSGKDFEYTNSGSLYAVSHEADLLGLESRRAWQKAFGETPDIIEGEALVRLEPKLGENVKAALFHPEESHVYAPDYVSALEHACRSLGVTTRDRVGDLQFHGSQGETLRVIDESGAAYEANRYVICTGAWAGLFGAYTELNIPVYPIRGQICAYHLPADAPVRHIVFGSQGYVVPKANGTLVCGASEDIAGFDNSVTERGIARLLQWNRRLYPFLSELEPYHKWAGLRPATQDGYPLLGPLARNGRIVFAAGHYRNGILLSPATAHAVADLIEGRAPRTPLGRFAPERFTFSPSIH